MKANVLNLTGKAVKKIDLPDVFNEDFRPDLIKRVVLSLQSQRRQPYGSDPEAGFRTAAHYHGKRRYRWGMMNRDMARLPRLHGSSPHLAWKVRRVPQSVKGRRAHPPKAEKIWDQKINKKEKKLALKSAISATKQKEIVSERGHKIEKIKELPLIINDDIQSIKTTKDVEKVLVSLGLEDELKRTKEKKIRPGKGKMRGRKYKKKIGPLFVVKEDNGIIKASRNIQGVNARNIKKLSVEDLAPGTQPVRLVIWSQSAIEELKGF